MVSFVSFNATRRNPSQNNFPEQHFVLDRSQLGTKAKASPETGYYHLEHVLQEFPNTFISVYRAGYSIVGH